MAIKTMVTDHNYKVSKLDYSCSVLVSVSGTLQRRMQSVFNAGARLVFSLSKEVRTRNATPPRTSLAEGSKENPISFMCSCPPLPSRQCATVPCWDSTSDVESRRHHRSGSTSTLLMPSTRRATLGDRAYPVAAARAWNALPSSVRTSSTYSAFRHQLKTLLFKASFEDRTWLRYLFVAQR